MLEKVLHFARNGLFGIFVEFLTLFLGYPIDFEMEKYKMLWRETPKIKRFGVDTQKLNEISE